MSKPVIHVPFDLAELELLVSALDCKVSRTPNSDIAKLRQIRELRDGLVINIIELAKLSNQIH